MKYSYILLIFLILFSCSPEEDTRKQMILDMPFKQLENYEHDFNAPVIDRIQEAPLILLDEIMLWDNVDNYSQYIPTEKELSMFESYLRLIPEKNLQVLEEKLVGIYFINNLIGSGLADYIFDESDELYCILLLNPDVFKYDISSWLTLRENSCFVQDGSGIKIKVECGTEFSGLLYILLHETTHIVDYVETITPYCESDLTYFFEPEEPGNNDFTKGIWAEYNILLKTYEFPEQESISYYGLGGPNFAFKEAVSVWEQVKQTPAASLYGCMSWAEDLAEYITWYHYTQIMGQSYKIVLLNSGKVLYEYEPFLEQKVLERIDTLPQFYD